MAYPKAYEPQQGYMYQILARAPHEREYEHCDYAVDKAEKDFLLKEYDMAYYGFTYTFKTILLPKKYWKEVSAMKHCEECGQEQVQLLTAGDLLLCENCYNDDSDDE